MKVLRPDFLTSALSVAQEAWRTKRAVKSAIPADTPSASMSVYTRAGDKGKTRLYAGKVVSKANPRVEAYGSVDELNSSLGVVLSETRDNFFKKELLKIQNDLLEIGAALSNPNSRVQGLSARVRDFEKIIDGLTVKLPQLENFILPGGGKTGSLLHLARTVARRAERRIVELSEKETVNSSIIIYMNRLSDLLFMFARFINHKEKKREIIWKSR